ncbi:hypothetical protein [Limnohabitans sp.]|uniref:hypothetical protein n=1 Tax=Limnohabitans sp. TaxID=1907725 RepID=UPI00286F4B8E|nr:hypothetical protein [Limnohabitans sp.]
MQFLNAKDFGDYAEGMAPTCVLDDDLDHVLGDPSETLLAGVLKHRSTGACPFVGSAANITAGASANVFAARSLRMLPLTLVQAEDDSVTPGRRPLIREGANAKEPQR